MNEAVKSALQECYYVGSLPAKKSIKYWLISKYEDRISERLKKEKQRLLNEGKLLFDESFKKAMSTSNPFLNMIKKESDGLVGKYVPVPLEYGKNSDEPKSV